jgi:hypothetical protein
MSIGRELYYESIADSAYEEYKLANGIWTTRDGREIPICEMTDAHLANCISMILRSEVGDGMYSEFLDMMVDEAERRKKAVK